MCLGGSLFQPFENFGQSLLLCKACWTIWIPRTVFKPTVIKRGGDLQVPVIFFSSEIGDVYPEIWGLSLIMSIVSWDFWKFKKWNVFAYLNSAVTMCLVGSLFRHFENFGQSLLLCKACWTIWIPRTVFKPTGIKRGADLQVPVIFFGSEIIDVYPEIRGLSLIMSIVSWAVWNFKKVERIYLFKFSRNYVFRWFAFPALRNFWPNTASV